MSFFSINLRGGVVSKQEVFPSYTITDWREATASFGKDMGKVLDVAFVDRNIFARDGYPIPCRIFNNELSSDSPVFIFYPGCAFLFDFFELHTVIASRIAKKAKIKVILVQFRLAPEYPVLTSLSDSYEVARYIALHPELFGIDPKRLFIGGWCSGANAATFVSKVARETKDFNIHHQILLGGSFDLSHSFHAFDSFEAQDRTLDRRLIAHLAELFYDMDSAKNPIFSPYWEKDVTNFPATTLLCGEFDALRNDSEAYFEKLKGANVSVDKIVLEGEGHNQIVMESLVSSKTDPTTEIAKTLRRKLAI